MQVLISRNLGSGFGILVIERNVGVIHGAEGGIRTPTSSRSQDSESCASASSATSAKNSLYINKKNKVIKLLLALGQ